MSSEILNEEENIEVSEEVAESTTADEAEETETTDIEVETTEITEAEIAELEESTEEEVEEKGAVLETVLETLPTSKSGMVKTINTLLTEMTKDELQDLMERYPD